MCLGHALLYLKHNVIGFSLQQAPLIVRVFRPRVTTIRAGALPRNLHVPHAVITMHELHNLIRRIMPPPVPVGEILIPRTDVLYRRHRLQKLEVLRLSQHDVDLHELDLVLEIVEFSRADHAVQDLLQARGVRAPPRGVNDEHVFPGLFQLLVERGHVHLADEFVREPEPRLLTLRQVVVLFDHFRGVVLRPLSVPRDHAFILGRCRFGAMPVVDSTFDRFRGGRRERVERKGTVKILRADANDWKLQRREAHLGEEFLPVLLRGLVANRHEAPVVKIDGRELHPVFRDLYARDLRSIVRHRVLKQQNLGGFAVLVAVKIHDGEVPDEREGVVVDELLELALFHGALVDDSVIVRFECKHRGELIDLVRLRDDLRGGGIGGHREARVRAFRYRSGLERVCRI
mmetsp:Transcript_3810/g.6531  ORF Transcript_3810/g.6531 Transcript_3810/m.6531 type:complete len:402 (-) Transcript_3810:761-1966(-)